MTLNCFPPSEIESPTFKRLRRGIGLVEDGLARGAGVEALHGGELGLGLVDAR